MSESVMPSELIVKVLDNPTTNTFKLRIVNTIADENVTLRVIDVHGRLMQVKENIHRGDLIEIGKNFTSGVYFAVLIEGDQRKIVKLVKGN